MKTANFSTAPIDVAFWLPVARRIWLPETVDALWRQNVALASRQSPRTWPRSSAWGRRGSGCWGCR